MAKRSDKKKQYQERVFGKVGGLDLVVADPTLDYVMNARGGKVYHDVTKHSYLDIPKTLDGKTFEILSTGFVQTSPIVTVQEGNEVNVYRIPDELSAWIDHLRSLSAMGTKLLPAKVTFGWNERWYAEIL